MMSSPIQSSSHFSSSVTSSSTGSSSCSHRNVATRNPLLKPLQTFQFRNLRHFHPPILTMARLLVPLFAVIISCALLRGHLADEPDLNMKVPQMIELRGFRSEIHRVITDDCYVLDLHRIVHPNGFQSDSIGQGRPVLFVHGLMGSSAEWIMNSAGGHYQNDADNRSLAFHLARIGFDIWLGNNRGNEYTSHVIYSKKLRSFSFCGLSISMYPFRHA